MGTRHASKFFEPRAEALCGSNEGRTTFPKETVNCPECRCILNNLRENYPERFDHTDIRATKDERREAAADMARDMYG
jgi:hypothetical protein